MRKQINKIQKLDKFILEDPKIKMLLELKIKILNSFTPKYFIDKETNTATAVLNETEVKILNKIDLLIKYRVDKVKKTVCSDCGDYGWIYNEDATKRKICPCHY